MVVIFQLGDHYIKTRSGTFIDSGNLQEVIFEKPKQTQYLISYLGNNYQHNAQILS